MTFLKKEQHMEKNFLLDGFNGLRNVINNCVYSPEELDGNLKYVVDSLALYWTGLFLFLHIKSDKKRREKLENELFEVVVSEYKHKQEIAELNKLYLFILNPKVRGFNIDENITDSISEVWIKNPIIKVCDYLLYPDCIADYENYSPHIDPQDATQWELFEAFENIVSFVKEYESLIWALVINKRI